MADMVKAEQIVDAYVKCWREYRPKFTGIYEDNDLGCEHLQLIQNGFCFQDLSHNEVSKLAVLLTRELRGQINWDHKFFWSYCAFLTFPLKQVDLFNDFDWQSAFVNLVHLVLSGFKLAARRNQRHTDFRSMLAQHVNTHLLETAANKWGISASLTLSVLEGLLRRKNKDYLNIDGSVKSDFNIVKANGKPKPYASGKPLNRVGDLFRCFEQVVAPKRGRMCTCLPEIKMEFCTLYTNPSRLDAYDLIDGWRNELMHGNQFWMDRVPILLNLICLLVIDEIDPIVYDSEKSKLNGFIQSIQETRRIGNRPYWDLFPPDL